MSFKRDSYKVEGKIMDLILLGAGGQAKDVIKNIEDYNTDVNRRKRIKLIGCIDDISIKERQDNLAGYPVFNTVEVLLQSSFKNVFVLCAVGDPVNKKRFIEKVKQYHPKFINLIHPSVSLHRTTKLGTDNIIFAFSVVSSFCEIQNHVSINYNCSISHDCVIKNYSTLCPGVNLGGRVTVEEGVLFGVNSCSINRIRINSWSAIGAGTTVVKNVPVSVIVAGNPGKIIKKHNKNMPII